MKLINPYNFLSFLNFQIKNNCELHDFEPSYLRWLTCSPSTVYYFFIFICGQKPSAVYKHDKNVFRSFST